MNKELLYLSGFLQWKTELPRPTNWFVAYQPKVTCVHKEQF